MHGNLSPEQRKQYLAEAEQELARVTEITKQTLRFYREPSQPTATEVSTVLDSVLRLHASRLKAAGVQVHCEIRSETATVLSTPGELRQILANIIGNATDAMRQGGCLRIRISNRNQMQHGGCSVRLTIADNGTGIAPDVLPTIFEPFVTTKGETGTGLGLWVTSEIVKKNGWKIRVRSSRNPARRGTVFSLLIPKLAS
jgi:signal transduction histidine kinase